MPQEPLPAPAQRVAPANLITPMHAGTPNPPTLPGQQLPEVWRGVKAGVEAGQQILQSKQIAAKAAAEAAGFEYQKNILNQYKKYSQWVDKQGWDENRSAAYKDLWAAMHNIKIGPQGVTTEAGAFGAPVIQAVQNRIISGGVSPENATGEIEKGYPQIPGPNTPKVVTPAKGVPPAPIKTKDGSGGGNGTQQKSGVDTGWGTLGTTSVDEYGNPLVASFLRQPVANMNLMPIQTGQPQYATA